MKYDAVIIGSGPNGLSAGIKLASKGLHVLILEGAPTIGGGMRTAELTLPGFQHDICSAVHPMGYLSPYLKQLPLEKFGLKWIFPQASVAHPLDGEEAVLLTQSLEETAEGLGIDQKAWIRMFRPFVSQTDALLKDSLKPLGIPTNPFLLARFGLMAMRSCIGLAKSTFKGKRARALFAGCAGHSVLPLDFSFTAALGLMFGITAHRVNWPIAEGGSQGIANALSQYFKSLGGEIKTEVWVKHFEELPEADAYLFDTDPWQMADISGKELPDAYRKRLKKYRFGPGTFKVDWALAEPIPWKDPRCLKASTVHLGGTMEEIAESESFSWNGKHHPRPYMLVSQQSMFDASRAPEGRHTGWGYCHVPFDSDQDMTEVIEQQMERFAPGFKEIILARYISKPRDFFAYNPNYRGGAVTGGAADIYQLFTRPVARIDPYRTPNSKIWICSASTPPGGGVHGMCGYHAALSVLKKLGR